ncbi:MAG: GNAT family N-acetyltransferase, partial [Eubacterium sp.]|nr:GNAT family N-acetyltransferase [Eubacterium sp.]
KYTLRKFTMDDIDFIFELKKLCIKWYIDIVYGWNDEIQYVKTKNELNRNIDDMKIIFVDNIAVGVTTFSEEDVFYRVGLTMIHPDYQNKGIGRAVLKDYIKIAEKDNKKIIIKTYKDNPAQNLYKRLGFKVYHVDSTHIHLEINKKG